MRIDIKHDEDAHNPREDDGHVGTIATRPARQGPRIGENEYMEENEFMLELIREVNPEFEQGLRTAEEEMEDAPFEAFEYWTEQRARSIENEFDRLFLSLTIRLFQPSSAQAMVYTYGDGHGHAPGVDFGMIYVERDEMESTFSHLEFPRQSWVLTRDGPKPKHHDSLEQFVTDVLKAEVIEVDLFINNQHYGFEITEDNPDGDAERPVVDACWGFLSCNYGRDWETNGMVEHWPDDWRRYNIYVEGELEHVGEVPECKS